ncbi:DNA-binding transcriptional response regulator, NtrC family, contains REC, AAA-type ATPase, and a Fis-type DNA-binding domains [Hymenobacter gelipurpurascens]|uniref:DNA-binding transcriptional response regulator, NtrC family, contains REC, AAA-type ATPase, and a Fis-type DNA-binding domains n=1 Tax=Hymenobacter gelipurpurascens TaxID=89968 RepID=A0A212UH64_9BACT|nr:sigma-54 dependent transcriptional regulator [Hymenobacter gelipurpurascens]SNC77592.1 DNA-binding transcriptional response regulator, NtrC family, contains REC, AAA-type ATPase, and a Fis-type DNA-binding domains [Hymenobacter gelipurpurascens]
MISKHARILVVDDEPDVLFALKLLLKTEVREVVTEKNPELLLSLLRREHFDAILLDMNYRSGQATGNEGFYWLGRIREHNPTTAVILITAYGDVRTAVRALKAGATDFLLKPWHNEQLLQTLAAALQPKTGRKSGGSPKKIAGPGAAATALLGESAAMQEVRAIIEKVAPTEANVLLLGENGTGKELVAKSLHEQSRRAARPFVAADVAALSEGLFESELFGHIKGAFTDAQASRVGRFEAATGGTLFLDEIGNIGLPQQAKLLTALQNRQVVPVGSNAPVPVDIRLLSATNAPLHALVARGAFRQDLMYRLNTVEITLPPLRERDNDVPLLAQHFAQVYATRNRQPVPEFSAAALRKLREHTWPGNVRELQHAVERAVILGTGPVLLPADFSFRNPESAAASAGAAPAVTAAENPLPLLEVEKNTIQQAIERHQGNLTKAAKELGLTRTALYRRLDKHDI